MDRATTLWGETLTPGEIAMMDGLCDGKKVGEIGHEQMPSLTAAGVSMRFNRVRQKLGAETLPQAVAIYLSRPKAQTHAGIVRVLDEHSSEPASHELHLRIADAIMRLPGRFT